MKKSFLPVVLILIVLIGGYFLYQEYINYQPLSTRIQSEPISMLPESSSLFDQVQETNGTKHLVPLDQIISGGPPKDGIPSIDNPQFDSVTVADTYLADDGFGIDVEINGAHRFYPFQILVWHEIVNDEFAGQPLTITYCPLCFTGIVFNAEVNGTKYDFGTSGKLYNNNLVMYDRQTNSLWSQAHGKAIVGDLTGTELDTIPSLVMSWNNFKKHYPDGESLSRNTGAIRDYTHDPYGDYYENKSIFFPLTNLDSRLQPKALVYGFVKDGIAKAWEEEALKVAGSLEDQVAGQKIKIEYSEELQAVKATDPDSGEPIALQPTFWFSWAATWPKTELYGG